MAAELHVPTKLSGEGGTSHTDCPVGTKETGPLGVLVAGGSVGANVSVGVTSLTDVTLGSTVAVGATVAEGGTTVAVNATVAEAATVLTAGGGKVAVGASVVAGAQAASVLTNNIQKITRNLVLQIFTSMRSG